MVAGARELDREVLQGNPMSRFHSVFSKLALSFVVSIPLLATPAYSSPHGGGLTIANPPASFDLTPVAFLNPCFQDLSTGFDATGNLLAAGGVDARWTVISSGTASSAFAQAHSAWTPNLIDGAGWIGGSAVGDGSAGFGSVTEFQTQFNLDYCPCKSYQLDLSFASDNSIQFFLNGTSIGGGAGFSSVLGPITATTLLTSGVNTLTAIVTNGSGPSGFTANVQISGEVRTGTKVRNISTGVIARYNPIAHGLPDDEWILSDPIQMLSFIPIVAKPGPQWVAGPTGLSRWITPAVSAQNDPAPFTPSTYWYDYYFDVDLEMFENPELGFKFTSDNSSTVLLNGVQIAAASSSTAYTQWSGPVQAPAPLFVHGENLLRVQVLNDGFMGQDTPTGLRVEGKLTLQYKKNLSVNISTGTLGSTVLPAASANFYGVSPEPDWQLMSAPASVPAPNVPYTFTLNPIWIASPATSEWIIPVLSSGIIAQSVGTYVYEMQLNTDLTLYHTYQIAFNYSADNNVSFYLIDPDGIQTSLATSTGTTVFQGILGPVIATLPKHGNYTLRAEVNNSDTSVTGLLVDGFMTALSHCP